MQYAMTSSFEKILPSKGLTAVCPQCESEVIAKCGNINVWHWAHKTLLNCKYFERNETEWHRNWKARFPEQCREVRFPAYDSEGNKTAHIADVYLNLEYINLAIEFQHSRITEEECMQRNEFYIDNNGLNNGMIDWIIDISDANYSFKKDTYITTSNKNYDETIEKVLFDEMAGMKKVKNIISGMCDVNSELYAELKDAVDNYLNDVSEQYSEYIKEKIFSEKVDVVTLHSKKDVVLNIFRSSLLHRQAHCYLDTGKGSIAMIKDVRNFESYLLIIVGKRKSYKDYSEIQTYDMTN